MYRGYLSVLLIGGSPLLFWGMFIPALLMPGTSTAPDGISIPGNFPAFFTTYHPNFLIGRFCRRLHNMPRTISDQGSQKNLTFISA